MFVAFDREYARSQGVPTKAVSSAMSVLLAVVIVLSIRIMGIVLLISLLTMPVVIANAFSKSYKAITAVSAVIAATASTAGVIASYLWEVPSGAAIIFILTIALLTSRALPAAAVKRRRTEVK